MFICVARNGGIIINDGGFAVKERRRKSYEPTRRTVSTAERT